MCPHCHYLTEILLEIVQDYQRLNRELAVASDTEHILFLQKALGEAVAQVHIAQRRIEDHTAADHGVFDTGPMVPSASNAEKGLPGR